jgi:hypothetical protein
VAFQMYELYYDDKVLMLAENLYHIPKRIMDTSLSNILFYFADKWTNTRMYRHMSN